MEHRAGQDASHGDQRPGSGRRLVTRGDLSAPTGVLFPIDHGRENTRDFCPSSASGLGDLEREAAGSQELRYWGCSQQGKGEPRQGAGLLPFNHGIEFGEYELTVEDLLCATPVLSTLHTRII